MNRGRAIAGWLRGFVQLLVEVESGSRPMRHIRPMLSPSLQARIGHGGRPGAVPNVGKVLLQTSADICEAVVLLHRDDRTSAITITLGRDSEGWLVTDLGRPEDPPRPVVIEESLVDDEMLVQAGWHREPVESATAMWRMPPGWTLQPPPRYDHAA